MLFASRQSAGQKLAENLEGFKDLDIIIASLPRGGVVLGAEIAKHLNKPLKVILAKKITAPNQPEFAIGAMVLQQKPLYDQRMTADIPEKWLKIAENKTRLLLEKRKNLYPPSAYTADFRQKTVILVDDGLATGLTMKASLMMLKNEDPQEIIVAIPVASEEALRSIEEFCDEIVILAEPEHFLGSVGAHYRDFSQVSDDEVETILIELS